MTVPEHRPMFRPLWLPSLPYGLGDGSRGWHKLAAVALAHDLDLPNPYADGTVGVPDAMGYAIAAVTDDGATLCERCVTDPANPVHPADDSRDGWGVEGWTHSGEQDGPDYCDHCGREWTGHDDAVG